VTRLEGRRVVITTEALDPELSSGVRQQQVSSFDELLSWWSSE
jgi:hypothetical protein